VLALLFAVYHSVTWFNLAPKAMPVQLGEKTVAPGVIAGAHYVVWIVLSIVVLAAAGAF
jgi:fumarate reductase subunit C